MLRVVEEQVGEVVVVAVCCAESFTVVGVGVDEEINISVVVEVVGKHLSALKVIFLAVLSVSDDIRIGKEIGHLEHSAATV